VANCARLHSNLFRAVQGRTLTLTLKAFIALVVTWCLLAVAAVVAASTKRFEGSYLYLVAAAVLIGLVIVAAIAMAT
jgi:flagellar biosynthesis protein FliR